MFPYVLIISFIFIFIAFVNFQMPQGADFHFFVYVWVVMKFIGQHLLLLIIGYLGLILWLARKNIKKRFYSRSHYYHPIFNATVLVITGFFTAYILLFAIAILHFNILAIMLNINPGIIGMRTERKSILNQLSTINSPPKIISGRNKFMIIQITALASSGTHNFYGGFVLKSIPADLVIPVKRQYPEMLLIDDILIITKLTPRDISEISPIVGYLMVKKYFPNRSIKFYPKISIMKNQEYSVYRRMDMEKRLSKIDQQMNNIENFVSTMSASLSNSAEATPDKSNSANATPDNQGDKNNKNQEVTKNLINEYKNYLEYFKAQRKRVTGLSENIPFELGIFLPPDKIRILAEKHSFEEIIGVLTHEYFHYTSYVTDKKRLADSFFEEGLTEYFTRAAVKDYLQKSIYSSYSAQTAILTEMMKLIPESEFADIYFAKDQEGLTIALDRVYGYGFYRNNHIMFELLQFASDKKQVLKIANEIMVRIGGSPMTEMDLDNVPRNYAKP